MTRTITGPEALKLLEEARDRKGADYVFPTETLSGCSYVIEEDLMGNPIEPVTGCIVGDVLINSLGLDIKLFVYDPINGDGRDDGALAWANHMSIDRLAPSLPTYGIQLDDEAFKVFLTAQKRQDVGETWGEAVEAGRRLWRRLILHTF